MGASILDLSKLSLYKFHYEQIVPRYSAAKLKMAYKDTDSLFYCVETEKVPLTMTDELQSKVLRGVVCLRSKLYSIDFVGGKKQSAKGVTKCVKKTLHHDLFKKCLLSKEQVTNTMFQLKSFNHQYVVNSV